MKKKVIVGIPVRNDLESLKVMLTSLVYSTNFYDEIVIVSNSDGETDNFLDCSSKLIKKLKVFKKKTETPLEAYNFLFEYAKKQKKDLFLTQTDVVFPKLFKRDWLESMNIIARDKKVGAVTCINGGGVSGPDYINGFHWLGGWCSYFPFRTLKKIGGYDMDFPNGYGVDVDHTYRIKQESLEVRTINYWVDHHMMNERTHDVDPDAEQKKQESSKYFRHKWKIGEFKQND